jgi:putative ABC transport system permease protein
MTVALLSVAIGATVFMGMMTVYADIERQMSNEFRAYGANLIIVPESGESMSAEEAEKAASYLNGLEVVGTAYYRYESARINGNPVMIAGVDFEDVKKVSSYWSVAGEYPLNEREVMVGGQTAELLAVEAGSVIEQLRGKDAADRNFNVKVTVTGVVNTGGEEEALIFMDIDELNAIMGDEAINVVECSVTASVDELNSAVAAIKSDGANISAYIVKQLTSSEGAIMEKLTMLLFLVTAVVLLLTMVCVSTTMTAVVAERRKEIGLKKAIGASNRDILSEFIGENIALGLIGGILGSVLGYVLAILISVNVFASTAVFRWWLIPLTLVVSLVVTVTACLFPIKNASSVEPALVLKGE